MHAGQRFGMTAAGARWQGRGSMGRARMLMCSSTNAGSTVASGAAAASAGAHAATAAAMRARLGACRPRRGACPFFAASLPRRRFTRAADIRRPARRPQRSARACRSQARRLRPTGLGAWLPGGAAAGRRAGARRAGGLLRRDPRSRHASACAPAARSAKACRRQACYLQTDGPVHGYWAPRLPAGG